MEQKSVQCPYSMKQKESLTNYPPCFGRPVVLQELVVVVSSLFLLLHYAPSVAKEVEPGILM